MRALDAGREPRLVDDASKADELLDVLHARLDLVRVCCLCLEVFLVLQLVDKVRQQLRGCAASCRISNRRQQLGAHPRHGHMELCKRNLCGRAVKRPWGVVNNKNKNK